MAFIFFGRITVILAIVLQILSTEAGYLGCYKENRRRRHFIHNPGGIAVGTLTPERCFTACGGIGYKYGAVGMGQFCFCGNNITEPARFEGDDSKCSVQCSGNPALTCGSLTHVRVFDTPLPMSLKLSVAPAVVEIGSNVTLTPTVTPTGMDYQLSMDYGDGLSSENQTNGDGLYNRTYHQAGQYIIIPSANNVNGSLETFGSPIAVTVVSPPAGLSVFCPVTFVSNEPAVCSVFLTRGTDLELNVVYPGGVSGSIVSHNVQLQGGKEYTMGNLVQEKLFYPLMSSASTYGKIFHHRNPVLHAGVLVGLEYFALSSASNINIYFYEQICPNMGQIYCTLFYQCVEETACNVYCGSGDAYATDKEDCVNYPYPPRTFPDVTYSLYHTVTVNITKGFGYVDLSESMISVSPGDVIAHDANGAAVFAYEPLTGPESDLYCDTDQGPTSTLHTNGCVVTNEAHQIRAIYSTVINAKVSLMMADAGNIDVNITVRNRDPSMIRQQDYLINRYVMEGVNVSIFDLPAVTCFPTDVVLSLALEPFTGSPATVTWDFGDGNTYIGQPDKAVTNHTYLNPGNYNLTATVANSVNSKSNSTILCLQDIITGVNLVAPASVESGSNVTFVLTVISGSDYNCTISFTYPDSSTEILIVTQTDVLSGGEFYKVLGIPGDVLIDAVCTNIIGSDNVSVTVRAIDRISGISLTPAGAMVNTTFDIYVTLDTGSDYQVELTYDGQSIPMISFNNRSAISNGSLFESNTGPHTVIVNVSNAINSVTDNFTFVIEVGITDHSITCTFTNEVVFNPPGLNRVISAGERADCYVTMVDGTSVEMIVEWGDGSNYTYEVGQSLPWSHNPPFMPLSHTYSTPMFCPLNITIRNAFNEFYEYIPVMVLVSVNSVELNPVNPISFTPPAMVNFTWNITSGSVPNGVTCVMQYGDGFVETIQNCNLTEALPYTYWNTPGTVDLNYTIFNDISSKSGSIQIEIVTPIVDMLCGSNPVAGIPGEVIYLTISADRAPGANILDLTFDCGIGPVGIIGPRKRQHNSPDGIDKETCLYNVPGNYSAMVTATSLMETQICNYTMQILKPVLDVITVTTNHPVDYDVEKACILTYTLEYSGTLPDDAWIVFDYGNSDNSTPIALALTVNHLYDYSTPGHRNTIIRVYNLASEVILDVSSGCYSAFTTANMSVLREPFIPVGSPDLPGYSVTEDKFRTDEHLKIWVTLDAGTYGWYDITVIGPYNITIIDTQKELITLSISEFGAFELYVQPMNPIYSGPVMNYNGEYMQPVTNLTVDDYGNETVAYVMRHFVVRMDSYGTSMCLSVDYGDGGMTQLYGDAVTCSTALGQYNNANPGIDDMQASFHLAYKYTAESSYKMIVTAWNIISSETMEFDFVVSGISCNKPNVDIINQRQNFRYPLKMKRCKRIKLIGIVDLKCKNTLNNTKLWTLKRWDPTYNVELEEINITSVASSANLAVAFDPLFLPYGLYRLNFKVTMVTPSEDGSRPFSQTYTFIEVVKCDVVVSLFPNGMSRKTVGPISLLTLSPKLYSSDPDIADGEEDIFSSFEMGCRDITDKEEYPDTSVTVTPRNLTDLAFPHIDYGGCFQEGPGWLSPFTGSVTFITSILKPNHVYEFLIIGYKDTRSANFTGQVEVKSTEPPDFSIDFKIPGILSASNKGKFFNPQSDQLLVAVIASDCGGCTYQYSWSVYTENHDYCSVDPDCMMLLESKLIDVTMVEGLDQEVLLMKKALFSNFDTDKFQVRLTITNMDTGADGKAYLNMIRNRPPKDGACFITPTVGILYNDLFTAKCENFTDDNHEITDYKIICEANGMKTEVCQGSSPLCENLDLASGDETNDNYLYCRAIITDELGASSTYNIDPVQVSSPPFEDFRNKIVDMDNSESDSSDVIVAIGSLPLMVAFTGAFSPEFMKVGVADENSDFSDIGCARAYQSTGLQEIRPRPYAFKTMTVDPDKSRLYEGTRNSSANFVYKMTLTATKCTIESIAEADQLLTMLVSFSNNRELLHRKTQALMIDLLETVVRIMKNQSDSLSVEDITQMRDNIATTCENVNQAALAAVQRPTDGDLGTQVEFNYDTNLESNAPEIPNYDNPADQLRVAKTEGNKYEQTEFAKIAKQHCAAIEMEISILAARVMVPSNTPTKSLSNAVETILYKNTPANLINREIETAAGTITIPANIGLSGNTPVVMQVAVKASAGIMSEGQADCPYSRQVSLSFSYTNGSKIDVTNVATPFVIDVQQDPNRAVEVSTAPFNKPMIEGDDYLAGHRFTVTNSRALVKMQFRFEAGEDTQQNQLLVLINKEISPLIDATLSRIKAVCMIPSHTSKAGSYGGNGEQDPYSCFIDSDMLEVHGNGNWSIGVRELVPSELDHYTNLASLPDVDYVDRNWKNNTNFSISYQLQTSEISCFASVEGSSERSTSGVKVLTTSTGDVIKCTSNHLTSFSAGWLVVPNTIDFDHVFSNADFLKNPTLYVTEIVIAVLYIIAMIWARRQDKDDVAKLGLLPLIDNDQQDKYYYEIMVDTGMRRHAGTDSKVYFILSGEEDETDIRTLSNSKRKVLSRGSNDGFLMSVPSSLGALMYLRIWHDNTGKGKMKSWYLNHILVRDIQTDKKYYFIANRWWAVEEDDGQVDRVIPVAGKEQMTEFSHLFAERASKNLSDGHLWFSVIARPPQSRFTRCQRVSCCFCLLYVSMLANAMFYELASSDSNSYQFGPFAISAEQIFIGIAVNLIVFPINFLIIMLFRKSKPRKLRQSRVEVALQSTKLEKTTSIDEIAPRVQSSMSVHGKSSRLSLTFDRSASSMSPISRSQTPSLKIENQNPEKKGKCMLPWGCAIFAWILLWLTVITAAVFVTFYGIQFGDTKCRKWITSMIVSFITSIFFTQPLKVLLFAIIFSVLIRKPGNENDEETDEEHSSRTIEEDEEYLHDDDDYRLVGPMRPLIKKPKPPNSKMVESARKERLKEIQMWAIVREILFYMFYMTILIVISYRSVNTNSYRYKFSMEQVFIITNNTNYSFSTVKNVQDYWQWARTGMLRGLRAGPYYNNYPPFYLRGYINDKQSRIMGYATLRQVRVRAGTCKVPKQVDDIIDECNAPYEMDLEENRNFGPGWTTFTPSNATRNEYIYRDADSLNGYPYWGEMAVYGGGGYVVNLDTAYETMVTQFEQLEQEKWIDEYTRAVFLEFTVYNPSVNLFAVSMIISEFRPSGGVFGSYRFEPCMLLPYMNDMLLFQIICEIIYLAFTVFFVVKELRFIYKQKFSYFKQFWNLIEISITAMSVTAVVIYFYRLVEVQELTKYFEETKGNGYMKFQYVGYWSEIFQYIIGFLVFLATIKFLKLLRFNKKICLLASTLKNSSNNLIHFSIIFNVFFLAFVQVFYLVYLRHLTTFKTFVRACEACVVMMMGKFDIYKMSEVNQWFTQIFLFLFVVTITFIVVNMFLSILNESFASVRNDSNMLQNDYEIVDFILARFKRWTGLGQEGPTTLSPEEMERQRNNDEFDDHMTQLDNQIDRFLTSISNMYVKKSKFDDFLNTGLYGQMAKKVAAHNSAFPPFRHPAPRPGTVHLNRRSHEQQHDVTC